MKEWWREACAGTRSVAISFLRTPVATIRDPRRLLGGWKGRFSSSPSQELRMRLPLRSALTVLVAGLALAACDDGLSVDGSLNQCHLGTVTRSISSGETQRGTLTNLDCRIGDARAMGWRFEPFEPIRVQIDLTSEDFDPRLILTNRDLDILGFDEDSGEGTNSRMWRNLPAGQYVLWVTPVTAGQLGDFELSVQEQEGASCADTVGELSVPDAVAGELTSTSCLIVAGGTFADPWLLELSEARMIQVDLLSSDFDAFLVVTDMEDEWIVWDDDSGEGSNARLTTELEAGSYKVWADTRFAGEMGAYELTIQVEEGAAAFWDSPLAQRLTPVTRPD
jgi:hypothetical protein